MKKIVSLFIFLGVLLVLYNLPLGSSAKAESQNELTTDYDSLVELGILDEEIISREEWNEVLKESEEALKRREQDKLSQSRFLNARTTSYATTGYTMQKGDIFITNGTSAGGLTGHAGIAVNSQSILHIAGYGSTTALVSYSEWKGLYVDEPGEWTKIYRIPNATLASQAATWAYQNYWNSAGYLNQNIKPSYGFGGSLMSKDPTYCSKIVWQAYRTGLGTASVIKTPVSLVLPYSLPDYFTDSYKPSLVGIYTK